MDTSRPEAKGLGKFLSDMIVPNIGVFIAWGLIAALFVPTGWLPNQQLAKLVDPMVNFLIPLLIAYQGGYLLWGTKGGVVGAAATLGVIAGADMPMFLGAMIMGPLGGALIKRWDLATADKIHPAFEVLVDNFTTGIIAAALAIFSFTTIGPIIMIFNNVLKAGIETIVNLGLLPMTSIFIEPAKCGEHSNHLGHVSKKQLHRCHPKHIGVDSSLLLSRIHIRKTLERQEKLKIGDCPHQYIFVV